jgi:hypothetical protein
MVTRQLANRYIDPVLLTKRSKKVLIVGLVESGRPSSIKREGIECDCVSGAAEALSFTFLGARNHIRPDIRREEEASERRDNTLKNKHI